MKKLFKEWWTAEIIKTEKWCIYEQGLGLDVYCQKRNNQKGPRLQMPENTNKNEKKKRSSNHQAHLTGQGAIFESCKLPKKYRKFLFSFVNSEAMENFCKLLDFANFSKLYWKAIFWLPVERLVLNTKNNGSGCHQLFFLAEGKTEAKCMQLPICFIKM